MVKSEGRTLLQSGYAGNEQRNIHGKLAALGFTVAPVLMTFKVLVDDNFHYMDESERFPAGEFTTLVEALAAAQRIVDEYLASAFHPGMSADELGASYTMFGEDPFIVSGEVSGIAFSAREYARQRTAEMCAGEGAAPACACAKLPVDPASFGTVSSFTDMHGCKVTVVACRHCRRRWLRYRVEALENAGSSARWWLAAIADGSSDMLTPERARTYVQSSTWCFAGGGTDDDVALRERAPIAIF